MEQTIADILKTTHKMNDDYIADTLMRYHLITGKEEIQQLFEGKGIDISFSSFISREHNVYLNKDNLILPITIVYGEPKIEQDVVNCTYKAYCSVWLEAGGIRL